MRPDLRLITSSSPQRRISYQPEMKPRGGASDAETLWRAFVAAQERSKATLALNDGIAAGKAYAAFLTAFPRPATKGAA
jgi:hypothetical protein